MGIDLFGWLRRRAREAVLGGIGDAVEQVAAGDGPPDLERLRAMLAPPLAELPAAAEPESARGGKKR